MAIVPAEFPIPFGGDVDATCWDPTDPAKLAASPITVIETKIGKPLPTLSLDTLRRYFLQSVVSDRDSLKGARVTVQLGFVTTLQVLLSSVLVPPNVVESNVCTRRKYMDIDKDMKARNYLYDNAVTDAIARGVISATYGRTISNDLNGSSPRTRVAAIAVLLILSANALN